MFCSRIYQLGTPYKLSPDGIELQACNATGHFALTAHLLPILKKTAVSFPDSHVRIVNVSSMAYLQAIAPDLSSLEGLNRAEDSPMGRYNHSKLNVSRSYQWRLTSDANHLKFCKEKTLMSKPSRMFCLRMNFKKDFRIPVYIVYRWSAKFSLIQEFKGC
jgi:hypothetical protein